MKNLKLFSKLQNGNTAFLLLRPTNPGEINYFLLSTSVNYNIVTSGICRGNLPNGEGVSFEISLTSVMPLIDKGKDLVLIYENDVLRFEDVNGHFALEPLCVQHTSAIATEIARKFSAFDNKLRMRGDAEEKIENLEFQLRQARSNWKEAVQNNLSGWVVDNDPFGSPDNIQHRNEVIDETYSKKVGVLERELNKARETAKGIEDIDLGSLRKLADAAARFNTTIALCDTYAVVELRTSYLIQKVECGVRAIQGKLLQQLLRDANGRFYTYGDDIVFSTVHGKGESKSTTAVFILPYLPNVSVTDSLITKGAVLEKYQLKLKEVLPTVAMVADKFDTMIFNMGAGLLELTNDSGEHFKCKFEVGDAKTLELIKMMRGDKTAVVTMSTVNVPRELQKLLGMFTEDFTIYVKKKKVIFQSDSLYAIFSR